ncbi:hypothetical protein CcaCcLH18_13839 [Colletotrichum camelliae]|nr:hypothetical protein CcaCcLH18_13839 [Colletotrichum camelliae]
MHDGATATWAELTRLRAATRLPFPFPFSSSPSICLLPHVFVRARLLPSRLSVLPPWPWDDVQLEAHDPLVRPRRPNPAALFIDHCAYLGHFEAEIK